MKRYAGCALILLALASAPLQAADPLPTELNLVPRDSAFFVSIRVADLWKNAHLKPLRDLAAAEEDITKSFQNGTGLTVDQMERVTIFLPNLPELRGSGDPSPFLVFTTTKPYDLTKVLEAWHAYSEAEWRDIERRAMEERKQFPPRFKDKGFDPRDFPKGFDPFEKGFPKDFPLPPKDFPKGIPLPPREKELAPPPQAFGQPAVDVKEGQPKRDEDPRPKKEIERKRDLNAPYYRIARTFEMHSGDLAPRPRFGGTQGVLIPLDERNFVVAPEINVREPSGLLSLTTKLLRRKSDGPLTSALNLAAGKHTMVMGANMEPMRQLVASQRELKILPIRSFLTAKSLVATFDFDKDLAFKGILECNNPADAKKARDLFNAYMTISREMIDGVREEFEREIGESGFKPLFDHFTKSLDESKLEVVGNNVEIAWNLKFDDTLSKGVTEAVEKVREAARRAKAMNNLKQLGTAVHNYESAMGHMPFPGEARGGAKPGLSWRVAILPYIEQEHLYRQFKHDEPWDSEHNKKLIEKMPKIFEIPGTNAPKGQTYYQTFNVWQPRRTLVTITDGTSNTIMITESASSVPWTKPDDIPFDPKNPPKLGGHFKNGFNAAMCDGSVRFVSSKINWATLLAAITPDGGEVLGEDW